MTPQEVAMKFASASATCRNGKCPFTSECRGTNDTCKMKDVAMIIRSLLAEIATLKTKYNVLDGITQQSLEYMASLEKINEYYYKTCASFQRGYKPKAKIVRKDARIRKKKRPKDPVEMDGDERYAYVNPDKEPDLPVVVI